MKLRFETRSIHLIISGAVLFQLGGCLGPNPGFFLAGSAANATVSTLVNAWLTNILGLGGG